MLLLQRAGLRPAPRRPRAGRAAADALDVERPRLVRHDLQPLPAGAPLGDEHRGTAACAPQSGGAAVELADGEVRGDQPRGRGMQIVGAIADDRGVEDVDGGERVWFVLLPAPA